jgi:hypothetical protein
MRQTPPSIARSNWGGTASRGMKGSVRSWVHVAQPAKVFRFEEITQARRLMELSQARLRCGRRSVAVRQSHTPCCGLSGPTQRITSLRAGLLWK